MKRIILTLAIMAAVGSAYAGEDNPPNECGNHGNNCQGGSGGDGGAGGAGGDASAIGIGVGIGGSTSTVVDVANTNVAVGGSAWQGQSQTASATNAGNNQSVGGQTSTHVTNLEVSDNTVYERNAPPTYLGNLTATMSCSGSFNAGGSDRNGSGAFGFTWTSADCKSVVAGDRFQSLGMVDVACRIWKTTDGFKRAAKLDPSLNFTNCELRAKNRP